MSPLRKGNKLISGGEASKVYRTMDYVSTDDRSIGIFWAVSYAMMQPTCKSSITWLSSIGFQKYYQ